MRGCLRYGILLLLAVVVAVAAALGVLTLREQGMLPWLGGPYRNSAVIVLDSVQGISSLTTTRYNFSTLVTSEREMPGLLQALYGERQALVAVGTVTAGIDLSSLSEDDVWLEDDTLYLRLPPPALQDCFLDESASFVLERDTGVFAQSAPHLEGQARQFAIRQFREAALDGDILRQAQDHGVVAITQFVSALNIPDVRGVSVIVTPPDPAAPLPRTCQS